MEVSPARRRSGLYPFFQGVSKLAAQNGELESEAFVSRAERTAGRLESSRSGAPGRVAERRRGSLVAGLVAECGGNGMGFMDWLRRLVGAGPARPKPERRASSVSHVRRDRDELTTFVARPDPPPPVEKTEVVAPPEDSGSFEPTPGLESTTVVEAASGEVPVSVSEPSETTPIAPEPEPEPAPAPAPAPADDADATLLIEPPAPPADDPDATLYLEIPKRVVGTLEAVKGELQGQTFELSEGDNQLGRSPECDQVLASMWISRAHARIECQGDQLTIYPMSDKITSVDGEPARQEGTPLSDGCKIQLGGTVFTLTVSS